MDNSIYVTLSKQLALFRDMDITANNLANANTAGFGAEHVVFSTYLSKNVMQGESGTLAEAGDVGSYRDASGGQLTVTGNPLDVAIRGNGFFAVETPLGTRYTRAGNFRTETDGTLINAQGYPVLDNSGKHIILPEDAVTVDVGGAGNLKVNGEDFADLNVVQFANPQLLEAMSGGLYKGDGQPQPVGDDTTVIQGSLEASNVQPVLELTHMIDISRQVANTAQLVSTIYTLQSKTADAWAAQSNG